VIVDSPDKLTLRSPELWVYFFGLTTLLIIALRRVMAQQAPLKDEVYMKTVAIEYVQSGVVWVRNDGTVRSINAAFAESLKLAPRELIGKEWYQMFAEQERQRLEQAYSEMLLVGRATINVLGRRMDGTYSGLELLMVAVHDHKMRFIGHHCLMADRTRERVLEDQLKELTKSELTQTPAQATARR
jgi:PAS domain S-box-containing protein